MRIQVAIAVLALSGAQGRAQQWVLGEAKTVHRHQEISGGVVMNFSPAGTVTTFLATDSTGDTELWRSDGTEAGTFRLADTCPGQCSGMPLALSSTPIGLFLKARHDGSLYDALWLTDGTLSGTRELIHGLYLSPLGWSQDLKLYFFVGDDGVHGGELWKTDGTASGTAMVSDLNPGPIGTSPGHLASFAGRVYFFGYDTQQRVALWSSNGTALGTRLVRVIGLSQEYGFYPGAITVLGSRMIFVAHTASGMRIWRSDGTRNGTAPLSFSEIGTVGRADTLGQTFRIAGSRALAVIDAENGQELLATDGTDQGTLVLTEFAPPRPFGDFPYLPSFGPKDRLIVPIDDGTHGREFWVSDGTKHGTHLLMDLCPGDCAGIDRVWQDGTGRGLLFGGNDGSGFEAWQTDGTPSGSHRVLDLCPGNCSSSPSRILHLGGRIVLLARANPSSPEQLWAARLAPGARPMALGHSDLSIGETFVQGSRLLFAAYDDVHQWALWVTNGAPAGTRLLPLTPPN